MSNSYKKPFCGKCGAGAGYYVEGNQAKCNWCQEVIAENTSAPQKPRSANGGIESFNPNVNYRLKSGSMSGNTIIEACRKSPAWANSCLAHFDAGFMTASIAQAMAIIRKEKK